MKTKDQDKNLSRREFIQQTAAVGASIMLVSPSQLFAETSQLGGTNMNIKSKGYAAVDTSGKLQPWEFERRPVGDNDILINIRYASICHSDIHQMKGHWGPQQYPQVPGHEIVGIVATVGKKLPSSKSVTGLVSAAWLIVIPSAKVTNSTKNSTAPKQSLPTVTRKKAPRREFPRAATQPISWSKSALPSTFPTTSASRRPRHCSVPELPPIRP
jgi:hypothetical protein